jgi:hypothetical protein
LVVVRWQAGRNLICKMVAATADDGLEQPSTASAPRLANTSCSHDDDATRPTAQIATPYEEEDKLIKQRHIRNVDDCGDHPPLPPHYLEDDVHEKGALKIISAHQTLHIEGQ